MNNNVVKQDLVEILGLAEIESLVMPEEVLEYNRKEWFENEDKSRFEKIYQEIDKQQFIKSSF